MTKANFVRSAAMALTGAGMFAGSLYASSVLAQTPSVPAQPHDPSIPAPHSTVPEKIEPRTPSATTNNGTLSDKLEKNDGVIKPKPSATPDMTVKPPVPDPGTTPVIPPPGSPGGNPNVEPK